MLKRFFKKKKILLNPVPIIGSENVKYEPAVEPARKKFRIYSKKLFLTYSRTNLSLNEVLLQLQEKFSYIDKYVICQEEHKDEPEKGKHIHAYIEFNRKVNILSPSKLDLKELDKLIHGEYQPVKNKVSVINYVKKDGIFITNFETPLEFELKLQKIAIEKGLSYAMDYFCEKKPELVSSKFNSIKSNLKAFVELKSTKLISKYKNFNYPEEILHWYNNEKDKKTLFLTGKSGVGKTSAMVHLLQDYNPLLIRDINALKDLKEDHGALILDDIDWSTISREQKIHLLDKDFPSHIRILHGVSKVSDDLIKVITSNKSSDLLSMWSKDDDAIERRLFHVNIDTPMFIQNSNVFINCDFNFKSI